MSVQWPLVVFFDGACPLCREEMLALKSFDAHARLELRDASLPGFHDSALAAAGIGRDNLMQAIHARDAAGRWYRGVDVFVLAYGAAGLHGVAAVFAHPRLKPAWDRLYPWVARFRQPLSRLGLNRAYGWLVRRAAGRARRRAQACRPGACTPPESLP